MNASESTRTLRQIEIDISLFIVALFTSALNICCLVILCKDKKLKEKRFNMLTMCLSVSDSATGLVCAALSIEIIYTRLTLNNSPPFCYIGLSMINSTFLFSIIQNLWICIERLIATFPTVQNPCRKISVVAMTIGIFVICFVVCFIFYYVFGNVWSESTCSLHSFLGQNRILALSIFQSTYLILVFSIIIIYTGVVVRIYRSWRRISPTIETNRVQIQQANRRGNHSTHVTTIQSDSPPVIPQFDCVGLSSLSVQTVTSRQQAIQRTYRSSGITTIQLDTHPVNIELNTTGQSSSMPKTISNIGFRRLLKTVITLGILILILLMSMMPKIILGFVIICNPLNETLIRALAISDLFLFLNPLLDPVVYVLRIRSFRQRIKCSGH